MYGHYNKLMDVRNFVHWVLMEQIPGSNCFQLKSFILGCFIGHAYGQHVSLFLRVPGILLYCGEGKYAKCTFVVCTRFFGAVSFNSDVSLWDVSAVVNMAAM